MTILWADNFIPTRVSAIIACLSIKDLLEIMQASKGKRRKKNIFEKAFAIDPKLFEELVLGAKMLLKPSGLPNFDMRRAAQAELEWLAETHSQEINQWLDDLSLRLKKPN